MPTNAEQESGAPRVLAHDDYGQALGDAGTVLRANALSAGLAATVPTCPDWTVRDLVVHLGKVQRWATDILDGKPMDSGEQHDRAGYAAPDLLEWFDDGWTALLSCLGGAPEDLEVLFFLRNVPNPRAGWARRQAHEATVHAVDAMAARLGRCPAASETWIRPTLAVDGLEELLGGFAPRRSTGLRTPEPVVVEVTAVDTGDVWTLDCGPDAAATVSRGPSGEAGVRLAAPAVPLYLGLWNRGTEIPDPDGFLPTWSTAFRILWG